MDYIVNNISLTQNLMCVKRVKNIQSNSYIFKIYNHVKFLKKSYSLRLQ